MSPQVSRNTAARRFYEDMRARYPDIDREWLRSAINAIAVEELKLVRRDLRRELTTHPYYHLGKTVDVDPDTVISLRTVFRHLDQRIGGENA